MLDSPQTWSAKYAQIGEWMQIDLGEVRHVVGVVVQGRADYDQWVTQYELKYSAHGHIFQSAGEHIGASDRSTKVRANTDFLARYVRFVAKSFHSHVSMRAGVVVSADAAVAITSERRAENSILQNMVMPAAPTVPGQHISAGLLKDPELLMHHPSFWYDPSVSSGSLIEMPEVLALFPNVKRVARIGRVFLDSASSQGIPALMSATLSLWNDGEVVWPATTRLRLVMGPVMGEPEVPLSTEVHPGQPAELTLQWSVPYHLQGRGLLRAGYVLESGTEPFGPLLLLEVQVI
jgi:hypothetical protein